jgi:hypothetical protein
MRVTLKGKWKVKNVAFCRASGLGAAVPELTRSADIKLNERVSLRRLPHALPIAPRTISPNVQAHGGKAVKRSYCAWRLCVQRACEMPRSTSSDQQWQFRLIIILFVIVVIVATSGWIYFLAKMVLWLFALTAE